MRPIWRLLSVHILTAVWVTTALGQGVFSITISTQEDSVKAGSDVRIEIVAKNISSKQICLLKDNVSGDRGEFTYDISVSDGNGNPVTETKRYGILKGKAVSEATKPSPENGKADTMIIGLPNSSQKCIELNSGEEMSDAITLNKLFDLTKPGKYMIQVTRRDTYSNSVIIKSNKIVVTVAPN